MDGTAVPVDCLSVRASIANKRLDCKHLSAKCGCKSPQNAHFPNAGLASPAEGDGVAIYDVATLNRTVIPSTSGAEGPCGVRKLGPEVTNPLIYRQNGVSVPSFGFAV